MYLGTGKTTIRLCSFGLRVRAVRGTARATERAKKELWRIMTERAD